MRHNRLKPARRRGCARVARRLATSPEGRCAREHLWPAALHSRLLAANSQSQNAFWLRRLEKPIAAEPQIRDVCARCNNGVLSELDTYICKLFDCSFIHMPARDESVSFDCDYHRLKRWLLKMSYNSARIHSAPDLEALQQTRRYILGYGDALGRSTAVNRTGNPGERTGWRRPLRTLKPAATEEGGDVGTGGRRSARGPAPPATSARAAGPPRGRPPGFHSRGWVVRLASLGTQTKRAP